MIDLTAGLRGAVRKYWLAQDIIRSLAEDEITGVEFAEGNLRHPVVSWQSGAKVYVRPIPACASRSSPAARYCGQSTRCPCRSTRRWQSLPPRR